MDTKAVMKYIKYKRFRRNVETEIVNGYRHYYLWLGRRYILVIDVNGEPQISVSDTERRNDWSFLNQEIRMGNIFQAFDAVGIWRP